VADALAPAALRELGALGHVALAPAPVLEAQPAAVGGAAIAFGMGATLAA